MYGEQFTRFDLSYFPLRATGILELTGIDIWFALTQTSAAAEITAQLAELFWNTFFWEMYTSQEVYFALLKCASILGICCELHQGNMFYIAMKVTTIASHAVN